MKRDKKQLIACVGDGFTLIDAKCVDLVELFNQIGLKTEFSCCGHRKGNFEIIFDKCVTDSDIHKLLDHISAGRDHTPLAGLLVKWVRYVDGVMRSNWIYQTKECGYRCAKVDCEFLSNFFHVAYAEENQ